MNPPDTSSDNSWPVHHQTRRRRTLLRRLAGLPLLGATGDDTFTKGEYIKSMEDAMDWLERYTFDQSRGLFFRYYHGESAMSGSYDDAYDAATGAAEVPQNSLYEGRLIRKSYDVYINSLNLACYT